MLFSKEGIPDMADKNKGKKTAKKTRMHHVPNLKKEAVESLVEAEAEAEAEAEVEAEAEDEGFKSDPKAESSAKAGSEEIEVEDLVGGLVNIFGDGLGKAVDKTATVVNKTATVGSGLFSDAQSAARPAVSAAMGGVIKICRIADDTFGVKDPGYRDKG